MTRDPASAQGVTDRVEVSPPDIAWSLDAEAPALAAALAAASPWVRAAYDGLRDRMVVARTCRAFDAGRIFRPAGHYRAIYMRGPDEQGGVQDDGVLAIKGTELFATDLEAMIASIKQTRHPHADKKHSNLEHFPIIEQKVPMALLVEEGLAEARQAQRFQAAHLERYGELAAAPIPLLVIRWPDPVVAAFRDALVPALSERAAELVALRMAGGLGVYVYYYRNPPLRALHLDAALESKVGARDGYRGRLAALEQRVEPRQVVADWVALVARMLALGFMPCTRASHETGQCLRSMNAVVDGGFVDLDSMQPLSALASEEELVETLLVSLKELSETVATFVLGSALPNSNLGPSPALVSHAVFAFVRDELRAAMEEEARRGAVFDPRLEGVLGRRDLFSGIDHVFAALYPAAPGATN